MIPVIAGKIRAAAEEKRARRAQVGQGCNSCRGAEGMSAVAFETMQCWSDSWKGGGRTSTPLLGKEEER